jgi:hypothetical protein
VYIAANRNADYLAGLYIRKIECVYVYIPIHRYTDTLYIKVEMDTPAGGELQTTCTKSIVKFRLHCFDITDPADIQDAQVAAIKEIQKASNKFLAATTVATTVTVTVAEKTMAAHDAYLRHVFDLLDVRRSPVAQ